MVKKVAVIGLGYFGSYLAAELTKMGAEILAIDQDINRLDKIKEHVTHAVQINSTDESAMKDLGIEEFDSIIISIGDDFEASLLTIAVLQKIGAKRIIVRANTPAHEKILFHLGIQEIILPVIEAAERIANSLLMEKVLDSYSLSSEYTIIEAITPDRFVGKSVQDLDFINRFEVSLITIKRIETKRRILGIGKKLAEKILGLPDPSTIIESGDILVIFGKHSNINNFLN